MHPAPSVIVFSVLSGLGFGYLAFLGAGVIRPTGWTAFLLWGLGYALAVIGLVASSFHLGNPRRALRAFTQWRTSWLSREAWVSVASLFLLAPMALSDWFGLGLPRAAGMPGAALALVTVLATSMIYTQIRAVPRWHHWITPVMFLCFSLAGAAILAEQRWVALGLVLMLGLVLLAAWRIGDGQFARRGANLGTATGLGLIGAVSVFEQPHTGGNYLLREMVFVVARKHTRKLRVIAVVMAAGIPSVVILLFPVGLLAVAVAAGSHLVGAFLARWLFFAEAEHVVGLYYGARG